jgi:hypothetical protein
MDAIEKAIHNLALAYCEIRTPNYLLFKAGLESLARIVQQQQLADMERDFQQACDATKGERPGK